MSRVQIARRKMFLHQQLSNYNRVAMRLSERLHELHQYSASIARGYMSPLALAGMPVSCMSMAYNYFANQFGPYTLTNVLTNVKRACIESNNPVLQNLAGAPMKGPLKQILENMPFDNISSQSNCMGYPAFGLNPGWNPLGTYGVVQTNGGNTPTTPGVRTAADNQQMFQQSQAEAYIQNMLRKALHEQQREQQKAEAEEIKVIEDEITQEQQLNNTRLQVVQTELKEVEQHEKDAIDRSKATYA